jgi:magnesium transporter
MQQRTLVWQDGKLASNVSPEALQNAVDDPDALTWLDLQIGDDVNEYHDLLANTFKLSHLTIDTIDDRIERAKLVEGQRYFYLVAHALEFVQETGEAHTPKFDTVFGRNYIITAHREVMPWLDTLLKAIITGETEENLMARGMAFLLHAILDALVDSYFPVLDNLDDVIDELEDAAVNDASDAVQGRLFRIKRSLAQMRRVISPQVEVAHAMIMRTGELIPSEIEPYFADTHDHLLRTFEVLDSYRDLMSGLLDVYLTTVSNRLNQVMKQLTIIATIFMPITFITGVFGQNFGHLPQAEHDNGYLFWYVLAVMVIITAIQIWYFKMRKWL